MTTPADPVAQPGDPDLDFELSGLLITRFTVTRTVSGSADMTLNFNISGGRGWRNPPPVEHLTGGSLFCLEIKFAHRDVSREAEPLVDAEIRRLDGWLVNRTPVSLCAAPGKWTLLFNPASPDPDYTCIPRSEPEVPGC